MWNMVNLAMWNMVNSKQKAQLLDSLREMIKGDVSSILWKREELLDHCSSRYGVFIWEKNDWWQGQRFIPPVFVANVSHWNHKNTRYMTWVPEFRSKAAVYLCAFVFSWKWFSCSLLYFTVITCEIHHYISSHLVVSLAIEVQLYLKKKCLERIGLVSSRLLSIVIVKLSSKKTKKG
jgi:hypothetical protein